MMNVILQDAGSKKAGEMIARLNACNQALQTRLYGAAGMQPVQKDLDAAEQLDLSANDTVAE